MSLKVCELFYSIQGETSYMGYPCIFIRLTGCNLRCAYCDTTYAYYRGVNLSLKQIFSFIKRYQTKLVTITGGEPLLQSETISLIGNLLDQGYKVLLETNGSQPIWQVPEGTIVIMDIKCPGSGMAEFMCWENIDFLKPCDEVKFVLSSREDYEWAKDIIQRYNLSNRCQILLSAVFKKLDLKRLAEWILKDQLPVRLQPQLHKIIWGEKRRK